MQFIYSDSRRESTESLFSSFHDFKICLTCKCYANHRMNLLWISMLEASDGISRTRRIFAVHPLEVYFNEMVYRLAKQPLNARCALRFRARRPQSFTVDLFVPHVQPYVQDRKISSALVLASFTIPRTISLIYAASPFPPVPSQYWRRILRASALAVS